MSYQNLKNEMFESLIKYAAECESDELARLLPLDSELQNLHVFSEDFKNKIKKLIKQQRRLEKRKKYIQIRKRIAAMIIILFVGVSFVVANVEALRTPVINFIIEVKDKFTKINIKYESKDHKDHKDQSYIIIPDNKDMLLPTYMPKGYELTDFIDSDKGYIAMYSNEEGQQIIFSKSLQAQNISFDTEDAETIKTEINNNKTYISKKDNKIVLTMIKDKNETYTLSGEVDQIEAIKIMKSAEVEK